MRTLIVILSVGLLAACAFGKFETPHLAVIKVDMVESDLLSQKFRVRMRVQNPNDRELPVRGITCKLELAGEEFGNGISAEEFRVPAYGEAEFDMLLTTNLASAILRYIGKKDRGAESVEYRLSGNIDLAKGMLRSIPFSDTGKVPVH